MLYIPFRFFSPPEVFSFSLYKGFFVNGNVNILNRSAKKVTIPDGMVINKDLFLSIKEAYEAYEKQCNEYGYIEVSNFDIFDESDESEQSPMHIDKRKRPYSELVNY